MKEQINSKSLSFTQHFLRIGTSHTITLNNGKFLRIVPYERGPKLYCQFAIADTADVPIGRCTNVRDMPFARMIAAIDGLAALDML